MCSCRVFCVSYFVEFFENSRRIQWETRLGGLEVGTTQAKEGKPKKENTREKMERKERSGIVP